MRRSFFRFPERADGREREERDHRVLLADPHIDPVNIFGIGPKWALDTDHVAIFLPVGFAFGEDIESSRSWEFHPTLFTTQRVHDNVEINLSVKLLMGLDHEAPDHRVAANVGLGIGPDRASLIFRPEVGIMFSTGGSDPLYHLGLGFSFGQTDKKRSEL